MTVYEISTARDRLFGPGDRYAIPAPHLPLGPVTVELDGHLRTGTVTHRRAKYVVAALDPACRP